MRRNSLSVILASLTIIGLGYFVLSRTQNSYPTRTEVSNIVSTRLDIPLSSSFDVPLPKRPITPPKNLFSQPETASGPDADAPVSVPVEPSSEEPDTPSTPTEDLFESKRGDYQTQQDAYKI